MPKAKVMPTPKAKPTKPVKAKTKPVPIFAAVIVDESSSMSPYQNATIAGFNEFLDDRAKEVAKGIPVKVWISKFSSRGEHSFLLKGQEADKAKRLGAGSYHPHGMTALNDAILTMIEEIENVIINEKQTPAVVITILTDGEENNSKASNEQVRSAIKEVESRGNWSVLFVGPSEHSAKRAVDQYHIQAGNSVAFNFTNTATVGASYSGLLRATSNRVGQVQTLGATANSTLESFVGIRQIEDVVLDG